MILRRLLHADFGAATSLEFINSIREQTREFRQPDPSHFVVK